ncbi:hypothetical protein BS78_06G098300 [Paspalum vaginatum]|nr:hypothetical protein BS78_06G098300 [Paspalum vaginatum]
MNRGGRLQPPSTTTTPEPMMITIQLHLRGEPAPPPTTASAPPLGASGGFVDADGVPSPAATAVSAGMGGENLVPHLRSNQASATPIPSTREDFGTGVEQQAFHALPEGNLGGEGELLLAYPTPASATSMTRGSPPPSPLKAESTGGGETLEDTDSSTNQVDSPTPPPWSDLLPEIVLSLASVLRSSRETCAAFAHPGVLPSHLH